MPKTYSEVERENIRRSLIREAEKSLSGKGVKDTSVDDLVRAVCIPKGTFYLFFPSKEELFYQMLVSFREEMQERLLSRLQELDENHIVTSLTEVFSLLVHEIYIRGIYRLYDEGQLILVARKLPAGTIEGEREKLYSFFRELFSYFAIDDEKEMQCFYDAFMLIQYSLLKADNIENPEEAVRMLLRGLILQLVGE